MIDFISVDWLEDGEEKGGDLDLVGHLMADARNLACALSGLHGPQRSTTAARRVAKTGHPGPYPSSTNIRGLSRSIPP